MDYVGLITPLITTHEQCSRRWTLSVGVEVLATSEQVPTDEREKTRHPAYLNEGLLACRIPALRHIGSFGKYGTFVIDAQQKSLPSSFLNLPHRGGMPLGTWTTSVSQRAGRLVTQGNGVPRCMPSQMVMCPAWFKSTVRHRFFTCFT